MTHNRSAERNLCTSLEYRRAVPKSFDDIDPLGTCALALAALNALGSFASVLSISVILRLPALHHAEDQLLVAR